MARLRVKVIPRSSRSELIAEGDGFKAYLHAAATDGQANEELIRLVSDRFDVPKTSVRIVRGSKSRTKEIEVDD